MDTPMTTGLFKLIAEKCKDFDLTLIFALSGTDELSVVMIPKFKGKEEENYLPIMTISGKLDVVEANIADVFKEPIDATRMISSNIKFYREQLGKLEESEKKKVDEKQKKGGTAGKPSADVKEKPKDPTGSTGLFDGPKPEQSKQATTGPAPSKENEIKLDPPAEVVKKPEPAPDMFTQPGPSGPPAEKKEEKTEYNPLLPDTEDDDNF